ncbi:MAG TPA: hypothetical protein VEZ71_11725, partial [Archangium sp.]|nr:hypothetical protein [Archangium sp.]
MGFKSGVLDMKPDSWTTLSSITEPALPSGQSRTLAPVAVPCGADLVVAVRARDAAGMFFDMKGLEARPTGAARAVFEIQDAGVVARWE